MKIFNKQIILSLILCVVFEPLAYAVGDTFQITTPPIPYPSYESGKNDYKMTGLYGTISGSGLDLKGGGFDVALRSVPPGSTNFALGGSIGMAVVGGNYTHPENLSFSQSGFTAELERPKFDMVMMGFDFSLVLEHQFIKKEYFSLIGFGGLNMPFAFGSISGDSKVTLTGSYLGHAYSAKTKVSYTGMVTSILYGIPFGLQAGIYPHRDWTITPFVFFNQFLGGSTSVSATAKTSFYWYGNHTFSQEYSNSYSIGSFMSKSYGADLLFEPWKLSLGAMLQDADSGGKVGAVKVKVYQMSYKSTF